MIDIEEFTQNLLTKLAKKNFSIYKYENNTVKFSITEDRLNNLLKIVFKLCSKNLYCFSIIREEYDEIEVIIYSKNEDKKIKILLENVEDKIILQYRKKF